MRSFHTKGATRKKMKMKMMKKQKKTFKVNIDKLRQLDKLQQ